MKNLYCHIFPKAIITRLLFTLLPVFILSGNWLYAAEDDTRVVEIKLGGYRFIPQEIQLISGQPTVLRLVNTDSVTPHNFTMKVSDATPEIDVDVPGGESIDVQLTSLPAGRYTFYCGNKLLFMKSHREKGMEGTLIVTPE